MGIAVHYPRNGQTYMVGLCGANSVSSTKHVPSITCEKCLTILKREGCHGTERPFKPEKSK